MSTAKKEFRSGFIAIIGRPNVGKSTLMNAMIGQKVAIMSDKPQTTRNKIQGVYTTENEQIIFIDTPGIHKPKSKLGDLMLKTVENSLNEVDAILFLVDAEAGYGSGDQFIIDRLKTVKTPVILGLNKIDKVEHEKLIPVLASYQALYPFAEFVPISALNGNNVQKLLEVLSGYLEPGPQYYPADQITDYPEQFICAELIREKLLHLTEEEVPHSIAVVIERMQKQENGKIEIGAVIYVERDSQKGIVIGKEGRVLKKVGQQARREIELLLGDKVFLELWVKVKKDWRNRDSILHDLGFRNE